MAVLGGILMFFLLEKLVLWRHCHAETCEAHGAHEPAHGHDHGRSGLMITIGDTFHNFVDGVMIAAAFLVDVQVRRGHRARHHRPRDTPGTGRFPDPAAFRLQPGARPGAELW
jgi:hypothetical protein